MHLDTHAADLIALSISKVVSCPVRNENFMKVDLQCGTDSPTALVIDVGSGITKAGFSSDHSPSFVCRSVVGIKPIDQSRTNSAEEGLRLTRRIYDTFDVEAEKLAEPVYPIVRGQLVKADAFESLLLHVIKNELGMKSPAECTLSSSSGVVLDMPVLLVVSPLSSNQSRVQLLERLFDLFNPPSIALVSSSVLAVFSSGRSSGLSVEVGHGVSFVAPILNGFAIPSASFVCDHSGIDVNATFRAAIEARLKVRIDRITASSIKENLAIVDLNSPSAHAEVTGGTVVEIPGDLRSQAVEPFFNDSDVSLVSMCLKSLCLIDPTIRSEMESAIILSGGTSLIPGFAQRLEQELHNRGFLNALVVADHQREHAAWVGGSMFASLETFQQFSISRDEFQSNQFAHKFI